jgi:hypothetical protein
VEHWKPKEEKEKDGRIQIRTVLAVEPRFFENARAQHDHPAIRHLFLELRKIADEVWTGQK